jgi:hypothetical protein
MLTGGRDQVVHVWSLHDFTLKKTVPVFEQLEGLAVLTAPVAVKPPKSKGGSDRAVCEFVTAGNRGQVRVWELAVTNSGMPSVHVEVALARQTTLAALLGGEGTCPVRPARVCVSVGAWLGCAPPCPLLMGAAALRPQYRPRCAREPCCCAPVYLSAHLCGWSYCGMFPSVPGVCVPGVCVHGVCVLGVCVRF